jgi:hypothetical protein
MKVSIRGADGGYELPIQMFALSSLDNPEYMGPTDTAEAVYRELIGTKQTRFGPLPQPEILVELRRVILQAVATKKPIPVLVPWGSEKPDGSSIDVAELVAIKTLVCLNARVRRHYGPGMQFRLRVEDLTALHLFNYRQEAAREEAWRYSGDLVKLVNAIDTRKCIYVFRESEHAGLVDLLEQVAPIEQAISDYLFLHEFDGSAEAINEASSHLRKIGWVGGIPAVQREHYLSQYRKNYPHMADRARVEMLARYLAEAAVRPRLGLTGAAPDWGEHIKLAFHGSVPGYVGHYTLQYRAMPQYYTSRHMAPWRAKGYLRITAAGEVTAKMMGFRDLEEIRLLQPATILLHDDVQSVSVKADFLEADED